MRSTALFLCAVLSLPSQAELVISEFPASNSGASLLDGDGEASDWIEIHNVGSVNLTKLN